jgi:sulfite reductase alpha subunit-like flavoprotein
VNIRILYATETGNAETLAEDLTAYLEARHNVSMAGLETFEPAAGGADVLLIVTSTYGDGELPKAARHFYDALGPRGSSLAGQRFSVFGLGDRQYAGTFGQAARLVEQRIIEHGGIPVCGHEVHDASGPEFMDDQARSWCDRVLEIFDAATAAITDRH